MTFVLPEITETLPMFIKMTITDLTCGKHALKCF